MTSPGPVTVMDRGKLGRRYILGHPTLLWLVFSGFYQINGRAGSAVASAVFGWYRGRLVE